MYKPLLTIKNLRTKLLLLSLFISLNGIAQRLKTSNVLRVSDSIILQNTNSNLFSYFSVDDGSYYLYEKGKRSTTGKFLERRKLKKNVNEIWVLYFFNYSKIAGLKARTWVKLNNELKLIEPVLLEFIPQFLYDDQNSNFISKEIALKIAVENFKEQGIKIDEPELRFDYKLNSYIYLVINKLNEFKNSANEPAGRTEVLKINAKTGEIAERFDGYYGLIIR